MHQDNKPQEKHSPESRHDWNDKDGCTPEGRVDRLAIMNDCVEGSTRVHSSTRPKPLVLSAASNRCFSNEQLKQLSPGWGAPPTYTSTDALLSRNF
jgi:hypothetical protein